jgi:iron complex outermembrane receptor protein
LQSDDEINNTQQFIFLQGTLELENEWVITSGASLNSLSLDFRRLSDVPSQERKRTFQNEWMPRISLLRKLGIRTSAYLTVARGFSAPTTAEVLPSTNIFNTTLQGETGWNYEAGLRGNILKNKFYFDINAFYFRLQNAIVQRRDASGADYFENAGSANQQGIESFFSYTAIKKDAGFLKNIKINLSSTINNFKYKTFKRLNDDFSGNTIPGVAKNTIAAGLDAYTRPGLYANLTYFQSGKIFLNDANTAVAEPYHIATIRVGIKRVLVKKTIFDFYAGIDNLLDETYSLGNDINAANGRYYNAAARRNFYAGLRFDFH